MSVEFGREFSVFARTAVGFTTGCVLEGKEMFLFALQSRERDGGKHPESTEKQVKP